MNILTFLNQENCLWIVQSLAHVLWQGMLLACLAAVVTHALRRRSAQSRYCVHCLALLLTVACLVLNLFLLKPIESTTASVAMETPSIVAEQPDLTQPIVEPELQGFGEPTRPVEAFPVEPAPPAAPSASLSAPLPVDSSSIEPTDTDTKWSWVYRGIVFIYVIGMVAMIIRLLAGLYGSQRLRTSAVPVQDSGLQQVLTRIGQRLRLQVLPVVAYSARVTSPLVVGVVKPAILLPVAILNQLTTEQVESLLLHELAHICRYDHWVNLLQRMIETVLFFHPAVWWMSHRISVEREHCCDDLAIRWGSERCDYAETLVRLSEIRSNPQGLDTAGVATLAAKGRRSSQLGSRVRRVLGVPVGGPSVGLTRGGFVTLVITAILLLATPMLWQAQAHSGESDDSISAFELPEDTAEAIEVIINHVLARREKYRDAEFRIDYRSEHAGVAGTIPYVLRTKSSGTFTLHDENWHCQTTEKPATGSLRPWRDQFWCVEGERVKEREFQEHSHWPNERQMDFNSNGVQYHFDQTLVRAIYGPEDWLIEDWRKFGKLDQVAIEEKKVGDVDCVVITVNDGTGVALAPQLDWAPIQLPFGVSAVGHQQYGDYWLPGKVTKQAGKFEGESLVDKDFLLDAKVVDGSHGLTPMVVPQPSVNAEIKVIYPQWDSQWDQKSLPPALELTDLVKTQSDVLSWPSDDKLSRWEQRIWDTAKAWRNNARVEAAINFDRPMPFLSPDESEVIWASYDKETRKLNRVPASNRDVKADDIHKGKHSLSGKIVLSDGSPAKTRGQMYYYSYHKFNEHGGNGVAGDFLDQFAVKVPNRNIAWLSYFADGYAPVWTEVFKEDVDDIELVLKSGVSQRISVRNAYGEPIQNAKIIARPLIHGLVSDHKSYFERDLYDDNFEPPENLTDHRGECLLEHLAETRHAFYVEAAGYEPIRGDVHALQFGTTLELQVKTATKTTGQVLQQSNGLPLAGAKIRLLNETLVQGFQKFQEPPDERDFCQLPEDRNWGKVYAITDKEGRFTLDQLSRDWKYLVVIETADGGRAAYQNLGAGESVNFAVPDRRDLVVNINGDLQKFKEKNNRLPTAVGVSQKGVFEPRKGSSIEFSFSDDLRIEAVPTGGRAVFRGLVTDLNGALAERKISVVLMCDKGRWQEFDMNPQGDTVVNLDLPKDADPADKASDTEASVSPTRKPDRD